MTSAWKLADAVQARYLFLISPVWDVHMGTWSFHLNFKGVTAGQLPGALALTALKNRSTRASGLIHVRHQYMGLTEVHAKVGRFTAEPVGIAKKSTQKFQHYQINAVNAIQEKRL